MHCRNSLHLKLSFLFFVALPLYALEPVQLVAPRAALEAIPADVLNGAVRIPFETLDADALLETAAAGGTIVWAGPPDALPANLWTGSFALSDQAVSIRPAAGAPLVLPDDLQFSTPAKSAFLKPPLEFPKHNIDEEIRAEFVPLLEAFDRFGEVIGYPAVLLNHVAPSLVKNRFNSAQVYCFFFDQPEQVTAEQWRALLGPVARAAESGVVVERVETNYASYQPGERVEVRARLRNRQEQAVRVAVDVYRTAPGAETPALVTTLDRVIGGNSASEARCDFVLPAQAGLHGIVIDVRMDLAHRHELAVLGTPTSVARRQIGFVALANDWQTPEIVGVEGPNFTAEGKPGFFGGTHYYPSNVWWEWAWRDYRPALAARDFAGMRAGGNRLVRVWVDPVLDEQGLRAMDAAIWQAAQAGITLDICVFNQWVRDLGFERASGEHVAFQFRHPKDFNLYSFSLRNLDLQREYLQVLATRWARASNVIYNLANETYVKDPDASQMDPEVQAWEEAQRAPGTVRDSLLFQRWGRELEAAVRAAGGQQLVFPGYLFSLSDGGDNYLGNAAAPLQTWHGYFAPEAIGGTVQYLDPIGSNRPLLLEEFGNLGWNNPATYDAAMHYALAAGAGAAMSYEWGVSWLAPEAPYVPLPIRDALAEPADPRWFPPIIDYAKTSTTPGGVGIAPWPSGFGYGSIYHGTPFMADAARAVWRLAMVGERFPRARRDEAVYVVSPEGKPMAMEPSLPLFKALWEAGVAFGVWQASAADTLPATAKAVILSGPADEPLLEQLRGRGLKVYAFGDDAWKTDTGIPRVAYASEGPLNCLIRRTITGTLYAGYTETPDRTVGLTVEGRAVHTGVQQYALIHAGAGGVDFIEGAGTVRIDGATVCTVEKGRVLLLAPEGAALETAQHWRVIVTEPTTLQFGRVPVKVEVVKSSGERVALDASAFGDGVLAVDQELARHSFEVTF